MDGVQLLAGLAALVVGAEALVRGASRLALSLGISPLVVGLTVVAFGTSAPETAVTLGAALGERGDIAVGNVVGSNVFNILFILGVSALIAPLTVASQLVRQELPVMFGASLLLLVLATDGVLGRFDGALLVALLALYTGMLVRQARRQAPHPGREAAQPRGGPVLARGWDDRRAVQLLLVVAGLCLLVVGARWLVDAAVSFARAFGVSELVIGLTVVAAGTSLPEVATSVLAAIRGERDIAVGNVVGSNIFNILGCLGLAGAIAPGGLPVAPAVLRFDLWVMVAASLACLPVFLSGRRIARWEGGLFLGYYVGYTLYVILAARRHEALEAFGDAMMSFVVPLTIVTLVVTAMRGPRGSARS